MVGPSHPRHAALARAGGAITAGPQDRPPRHGPSISRKRSRHPADILPSGKMRGGHIQPNRSKRENCDAAPLTEKKTPRRTASFAGDRPAMPRGPTARSSTATIPKGTATMARWRAWHAARRTDGEGTTSSEVMSFAVRGTLPTSRGLPQDRRKFQEISPYSNILSRRCVVDSDISVHARQRPIEQGFERMSIPVHAPHFTLK